MNTLPKRKRRSSTESPTSFSSLPYDIAIDCLARIPRVQYPTLSLVSRTFRALIASPELYATRSRIGKTESFLYVCLNLNKNIHKPSWFMLPPIPDKQKLIPIPSFPYQHPISSTVISIGSEIYIIGGRVNGIRSRRVLIFNCRSHQWRQLPNMRIAREEAAVDVFDGKIHVIGGCKSQNREHWGEVYDLKKQTWEPISPTKLFILAALNCVDPSSLVMGEKFYDTDGLRFYLVEIEKIFCEISVLEGYLNWRNPKVCLSWKKVMGLERLPKFPNIDSVGISSDGTGRVKVWWSVVKDRCQHGCQDVQTRKCKTEIWCAELSLEIRKEELWGSVEWFKNVYTFHKCDSLSSFFMHSVTVTH